MTNTELPALFQIMRFNILNAARSDVDKGTFSDAYIFSWENSVFPIGSNLEYHKPFEDMFQISKSQMDELAELLDERWIDNNPMTFYELEDHYGGKHNMSGGWDRSKLLYACRYFYLREMFNGHSFWETMLKEMEHPIEASLITRSVD